MVERVQRRASKCVSELFNLDYEDHQAAFNLPSHSYQRHRANMHNILHENFHLYPAMFFHPQLSSVTRGHCLKLFKPHAQKIVCSNIFLLDQLMLGISY